MKFILIVLLLRSLVQASDVCTSEICYKEAKKIMKNIDPSVDPCENFFQFACGNYIRNTQLEPGQLMMNSFQENQQIVQQQLVRLLQSDTVRYDFRFSEIARKIFRSCLDIDATGTSSLETLKDVLKTICGWPLFHRPRGHCIWSKLLQKLYHLGIKANYLFGIGVHEDIKKTSRYIIIMHQPKLFIDADFLKLGINNPIVKSFYNCMVDIAVILGADQSIASTQLWNLVKFEAELAAISIPKEKMSDFSSMYNLMDIGILKASYPYISWLQYIRNIFPKQRIEITEPILNLTPDYFKNLPNVLQKFGRKVVLNYIAWRVILSSAPYLTKEIRERMRLLQTQLSGSESSARNPLIECVSAVHKSMPLAIGSLYVRRHFDIESKNDAANMVHNILLTFMDTLLQTKWMERETRLNAIEKASSIIEEIGYSDEFLNDRLIENYYETLIIKDDGNYFQVMTNITKFEMKRQAAKLRTKNDKKKTKLEISPAETNAYYNVLRNSITFPAAILQNTFFSKNRPKYINYGMIGSVIGHEITHGFDNKGSQFDSNGNLNNWWDNITLKKFATKTQCFVHQYNNYTMERSKMKINGLFTLSENIADAGGYTVSYNAYKRWIKNHGSEPELPGLNYTPKQLFWISAASLYCDVMTVQVEAILALKDTHSPGMYRTIGSFSNIKEFAKDFQCAEGTFMNPITKCKIW